MKVKIGRNERSGYVYLAVLFSALIVSAAVAAALSVSTANVKSQVDRDNRSIASRFAEAELHRQAARLSADPTWRDNHSNGAYSEWWDVTGLLTTSSDRAMVRYQVSDEDGDLSDDASDLVQLTAHARIGDSESAVTVTLEPGYKGLELLENSVTASDDIRIEYRSSVVCNRNARAIDDCKTSSSGLLVAPRLFTGDRLSTQLRGEHSTGVPTMPSHDVVDVYVQEGTQINASSLPLLSGRLVLSNVLLTAADNPFGSPDSDGIYWIDGGGATLEIANCRFGCTLAVKNVAYTVISGAVVWEPATNPEAILVSSSSIAISGIDPQLDEVALSKNFNPPSSPYRGSESNSTISDSFPTEFRGLIYSPSDIYVLATNNGEPVRLNGPVIGHDVVFFHDVQIMDLPDITDRPPRGFINPVAMRFIHGSMRRVPTP